MNSPMLAARFSDDAPTRLLPLYAEQEERCDNGRPFLPLLDECGPDGGVTVAGSAQDVMFFIGFVAAQGENSLLSVRPL